ncbi:hypothetical protein NPIL_317661 [Nephila pilipes]|uniref:Uncharacterized protein n=1 Tax=Nephila pilipes TaxID=299642 RepID=A0A8X6IW36_NEPPI|nr:hypothetical protein NPIL_317661 [Nephila pilipes]
MKGKKIISPSELKANLDGYKSIRIGCKFSDLVAHKEKHEYNEINGFSKRKRIPDEREPSRPTQGNAVISAKLRGRQHVLVLIANTDNFYTDRTARLTEAFMNITAVTPRLSTPVQLNI